MYPLIRLWDYMHNLYATGWIFTLPAHTRPCCRWELMPLRDKAFFVPVQTVVHTGTGFLPTFHKGRDGWRLNAAARPVPLFHLAIM
jgi:hypothetical protein